MKGLKKKRRIQIIALAFAALALSTGMIGYAMRGGINYFRSPTQILSDHPPASEIFRIGGLVEDGSIDREGGKTVTFRVTDGKATVPVTYTGILPDLFGEGQGMVGTGTYVAGVFHATEILAKHDANYMPKEVVDALKKQGVYEDPNKSGASDTGDSKG